MKNIKQTALVPYSAEKVFKVVNDVEAYPSFLPWCSGSEVLSNSLTEIVARLDISGAGVTKSFTTRNRVSPFERIDLTLLKGPFKKLEGFWKFTTIPDLGCKVEVDLSFEFEASFLELPFSRVFDKSASKLVDAFCIRLDQQNG